MAEKANYFADVLGYDVMILTTEQKGRPACYPLSEKIDLIDINVNYFRDKSYFHPSNLAKIPKHFSAWKSAVRKAAPDIIISCNYAFDFYWLPFSYRAAAKLKEYHSSRYFYDLSRRNAVGFSRIRYFIDDLIEAKFDRLIVLNPDERSYFRSNNVVDIPNSIEVLSEASPLNRPRAIAAGRIAPVKGFETMIRAWKQIAEKLPGWQLNIFGQGENEYIQQLKRLIDELGLTSIVFLNGATSSLRSEMIGSSVYLMTSKTECYPMVLLESLSVGLPVVTFDCPTGPRHIIKNGETGILVPDQDVDSFVKEVVLLAQNPEVLHKLGKSAKNDAARFSNESVMRQWVSLFDTLNR